jgi:hypothetical protein
MGGSLLAATCTVAARGPKGVPGQGSKLSRKDSKFEGPETLRPLTSAAMFNLRSRLSQPLFRKRTRKAMYQVCGCSSTDWSVM